MEGETPPESPGLGSPLTYTPQVPMEPLPGPGQEGFSLGSPPPSTPQAAGGLTEFHGVAGWASPPTLIPTVLQCA